MLTMLKINEVVETRKVVVTAIFWAADHHPYVSRGDRRPGRGRRGETGRARLALCALSEMSNELDDAKASFVVAEVVGLGKVHVGQIHEFAKQNAKQITQCLPRCLFLTKTCNMHKIYKKCKMKKTSKSAK